MTEVGRLTRPPMTRVSLARPLSSVARFETNREESPIKLFLCDVIGLLYVANCVLGLSLASRLVALIGDLFLVSPALPNMLLLD